MKIETEEVMIYFVGKSKISKMHEQFFQDASPTDCISFPCDLPGTENGILGEIFVCPVVAQEYAAKHELDLNEEITLYVIHGLLHLIGYDDLSPADKKAMRCKERYCMNLLKKNNLV